MHIELVHLNRLLGAMFHLQFSSLDLIFPIILLSIISRHPLFNTESSRLSAELNYLAKALRSADMHHQTPLYAGTIYHQPPSWGDPYLRSPDLIPAALHTSPLGGLPGSEFMGSIESILQTSTSASPTGNLLTLEALRDHMELLVKIHKLEVKVGASKWRLEDLCQRAELPSAMGLHSIESLLAQLIPCVVITPADCFWEGSKVIAPDTVVQIPWWVLLFCATQDWLCFLHGLVFAVHFFPVSLYF